MRIDIDSFREVIDTLTRNKSRSFLTGFGVFWGVFMLVALIGGGNGLKEMLSKNFEGFATNSAFLWSQRTSKAYKGFQKGRWWQMEYSDVERLKQQIPELDRVVPMLSATGSQAYFSDRKASVGLQGVSHEMQYIQTPQIRYGRYLNAADMAQRRKVCVIGKKVYQSLFPGGGDPCGRFIRVDSIYYQVVGVNFDASDNMNFGGGEAGSKITLPVTLVQQIFNRGNGVDIIAMTCKKGVVMSQLTPRIRQTICRKHAIDPTDEKGLMVFNTEMLFQMVDNLFKGVNFLIWLVGLGTLLAGAIGVSNIMMVTVRERTTEIGIRRAIGATPKMILSQIVAESITLTLVAGMSGIMLAVAVLQMLELGSQAGGEAGYPYQVGFWTALLAAAVIVTVGVLAGLAPAARAMSIKPVDAMRDE